MSNNALTGVDNTLLLTEIEEIIRSMPPREQLRHDDQTTLSWLGRAGAAIDNWRKPAPPEWSIAMNHLLMRTPGYLPESVIQRILYQAQSDLRLRTIGPTNVAVVKGQVFQYFDELRKVIEQASTDILFVDPYMDAEFVARYLPQVKNGVSIRMLGRKNMAVLIPAAKLFAQESGKSIMIRSTASLHDRYVFIDKSRCFQSGSSFKDGPLNAGTTLTENVDACSVLFSAYDTMWQTGSVQL
jgi:hypothetical protein